MVLGRSVPLLVLSPAEVEEKGISVTVGVTVVVESPREELVWPTPEL